MLPKVCEICQRLQKVKTPVNKPILSLYFLGQTEKKIGTNNHYITLNVNDIRKILVFSYQLKVCCILRLDKYKVDSNRNIFRMYNLEKIQYWIPYYENLNIIQRQFIIFPSLLANGYNLCDIIYGKCSNKLTCYQDYIRFYVLKISASCY